MLGNYNEKQIEVFITHLFNCFFQRRFITIKAFVSRFYEWGVNVGFTKAILFVIVTLKEWLVSCG
jgi:hypothetical protein